MGGCTSSPVETSVETPAAIKPRKKTIPKSLKRAVWDEWIGEEIGITKCLCCNHQDIRQIEFHCGHVIAETRGGTLSVQNLRPICAQCNLSMGTMSIKEFKHKYFNKNTFS